MGKNIFIGFASTARRVKKVYLGVDGVARKIKRGYVGVDGIARLFYAASPEFTGNYTQIAVDSSRDRLFGHARAGDYALFSGYDDGSCIVAIDSSLTVQYLTRTAGADVSGRFPFGYLDGYALWGSATAGLAVSENLTQTLFDTSELVFPLIPNHTGTYLKDRCIGVSASADAAHLSIVNSSLTSQLVSVSGLQYFSTYTTYCACDISKCGDMYMIFDVLHQGGETKAFWYNIQLVLSGSYTLVNQVISDRFSSRSEDIQFYHASNLLELDPEQAIAVASGVDKGDMWAQTCCVSRMDAAGTVRSYTPSVGYGGYGSSVIQMSNALAIIGKSSRVCILSNNTVQGYGGASYYDLDTDTFDIAIQPWHATLISWYCPSPNGRYYIRCNGSSDHGGEGNGPRYEENIMTCIECR